MKRVWVWEDNYGNRLYFSSPTATVFHGYDHEPACLDEFVDEKDLICVEIEELGFEDIDFVPENW